MTRFINLIPIMAMLIISTFVLLYITNKKDPLKPPTPLLNKNIPEFNIKNLFDSDKIFSEKNLQNKVVLINFFASWCFPCKIEHPLFFEIKKDYPEIFLLGVNFKDKLDDAANYLNKNGNPYSVVVSDDDGMLGFDFGVLGLPETFLVNKEGKIIFKHIGKLTREIINDKIKPLLQNL